MSTSFASFAISPNLVSALKKLGYEHPSPVQERVIPKALAGKSLVCQSETGSGKTHAYLIPILEKIDFSLPRLQCIILTPSRELARQVYEFASSFSRYFPKFKVRLFSSETEKGKNEEGLSIPPHMIVATPGRAKDLLVEHSLLPLHGVKTLVLDEADMLCEFGYFEDIDALYGLLNEKVQTMVFSATLNTSLKAKLERYVASEFLYEGEDSKTAVTVSHHLVDIRHVDKFEALIRFLNIRRPYLALIFASKKEDVKAAYARMKQEGLEAICFLGDLDARERKQALRAIKSNHYPYVVCSDLLSRGIDIEDVSDVISLDLPGDLSYYYHRAGRSGRFGKSGDSWVFYDSDDTRRAKTLLGQGVAFDFYSLKGDNLAKDTGSLHVKERPVRKKEISDDQRREIGIAKAKTKIDAVKPGYKAKRKKAVAKVDAKYRRKAIKDKVREQTRKNYVKKAKEGK